MIIAWLFTVGLVHAQGVQKHPRVVELEAMVQSELRSMVEARFPNQPTLISVDLMPLRRVPTQRGEGYTGEQLPYYDLTEVEILDEWDDPTIPVFQLLSRIRRAEITILIPDTIQDDHVSELRESVFKNFKLIPGRDKIEVVKRNWVKKDPKDWTPVLIWIGMLFGFLVGLYIVMRLSLPRAGSKAGGGEASPAPARAAGGPVTSSTPSMSGRGPATRMGEGVQLQLNDAIKLREFILTLAQKLEASPVFPTLEDMVSFEKIGQEDPGELGALLTEFSTPVRDRLFAFSSSDVWLEAIYAPADLGSQSLLVVEKMIRNQNSVTNKDWQQLLVRIWRLEQGREDFLRQINREHAFAILNQLPKSISVPTARHAFPGAWGVLLDPNYDPPKIPQEKILEYTQKIDDIYPLRNIDVIDQFRRDRDLMDYLENADVLEERDIYQASPQDSSIHELRPPFYRIFDIDKEGLKAAYMLFSLEQWAIAVLNVPREMRRPLEEMMTEKELYMFRQMLRDSDVSPPSEDVVAQIRNAIGRYAQSHIDWEKKERAKDTDASSSSTVPEEPSLVSEVSSTTEPAPEEIEPISPESSTKDDTDDDAA